MSNEVRPLLNLRLNHFAVKEADKISSDAWKAMDAARIALEDAKRLYKAIWNEAYQKGKFADRNKEGFRPRH